MDTKVILIVAVSLVLVLVIAVGACATWRWMGRPRYVPGALASGEGLATPLDPPPQDGAANTFVVAPEMELHNYSQGEGPVVLVIHGGPGMPSYGTWAGLDRLSDRYRFVYYHQRGCGDSTRPVDTFEGRNVGAHIQELDARLGLAEQIADIERIRRILGEEQLILLGHSYGGFLAALYAAEFPDRVSALVLVSPAELVEFPPPSGGLYAQVERDLPDDLRDDFAAFQREVFDFRGLWTKSDADLVALQERFTPYYVAAVEQRGGVIPETNDGEGAGGWMVWAQFLSMGRRHDYSEALGAYGGPVLVLHGEHDLQPEQASRLYLDYFPQAQFEVVDDASHFAFEEKPEAFATTVAPFLADVG